MADKTTTDPDDYRGSAAKPASSAASQLTLAERFLIDVARQSGIGDADAAAVVIGVLGIARRLMQTLARRLEADDFSSGRLLTLVTLKALDPLSSTPAELAAHVDLTRPAMTGILDGLKRRGWIARARPAADRRTVQVRLTAAGQRETDRLITDFLLTATSLAGAVPATTKANLVADCRVLAAHSRRPL
jgi:DNA-binding MarR family transcriptional regulator